MWSVPLSTNAPLPACGNVARSARRSIPGPSRRFCQACDRAMCSDLHRHHCLLLPLVAEDCTFFLLLVCSWLPSRLSSRYFPSSWPGTAPFRSCLWATRKPLTRWRLAPAQEAARGTSPSSSLQYYLNGEVPNRILTTREIFYAKAADSSVLSFTHYATHCANNVHSLSVVDHVIRVTPGCAQT